jgi:hypothetical protein
MHLTQNITLVPFLHGKAVFAEHVRELCLKNSFDCIAVDIPELFSDDLPLAVDELPFVSAVVAQTVSDPVYYIPVDPCDAIIEGIRQSRQNRIPCRLIGLPVLQIPAPLPPFPDEHAVKKMGFDAYSALCIQALSTVAELQEDDLESQYIARALHELESKHSSILALVHFRNYLKAIRHFSREISYNQTFPKPTSAEFHTYPVNPDHLYFVLGELPFVAGKFEKARQDVFAGDISVVEVIKDLFRETRDDYYEDKDHIFELSPARIQIALTYLRNLTVMTRYLIPSLFDIVEAAKGVGGNAYAIRILKSAKYYPYLPIESGGRMLSAGINQIVLPGESNPREAINLFRDIAMEWRTLSIKPDPSLEKKKLYRYKWNPSGMCSHVPEDQRIESFNAHLRKKARRILVEDMVKIEKLTTSLLDGIDIRETLRHFYDKTIYVKELPPERGNIDSVVIIFDEDHDNLYPHCATWYAEHEEESTLTFYATDPFENLVGPGVARARYGGLSLLFPPRIVPNIFELTKETDFKNNAQRLAYGGMLFSKERNVVYVSARRPDMATLQWSRKLKKHLIWMPISHFSNETLRKLRRFHVLNGREVRSWAARFIGD